jgi:hypothetical protein
MCPFVKDRLYLFDTFLNDRLAQSNTGNIPSNNGNNAYFCELQAAGCAKSIAGAL